MKVIFLSKYVHSKRREVLLFQQVVQAGFPSPADDYVDKVLDINELLQVDESSTFFVRAEGESMINSGIWPGDVLCVKKGIQPSNGKIVIISIDNEFTVKRYKKNGNKIIFEAANNDYPDIIPQGEQEVKIWGVVTGITRIFN